MGWDACNTPMVTPDGKTVVCPTIGFGAFPEYSTATGKLTRTLYQAGDDASGEVLWASPSGDALIGYLNASAAIPGPGGSVGVITASGFRPLSFPLASGVPLPMGWPGSWRPCTHVVELHQRLESGAADVPEPGVNRLGKEMSGLCSDSADGGPMRLISGFPMTASFLP